MRKISSLLLGVAMVVVSYGLGSAFDLTTLDHVAVSMPRSSVLSLIGKPDEVQEGKGGLEIEVYKTDNLAPMLGTGCIYGKDRHLAGQSFIFQGEMSRDIVKKLQQDGFELTEEKGDSFRMLGKDDDTGQPLVVQIFQGGGLTIVMSFEKGFYDRAPNGNIGFHP